MASSPYKKLQTLQRKEEALRERLKDLEQERKAIIGPMRTRMINACDRAITRAIQTHIDAALSSTVQSDHVEKEVYAIALRFFGVNDEKNNTEREENTEISSSVLDEDI